MNKRFLLALVLFAFALSMAQKQRVAIMPTVADAEAKLSPREQGLLMERLRTHASDVLPKSDFILLQQNYVIEKLGEESFFKACKEGSCVGELIAMVSADFGARCEVFVANNKKWLKFELYGTLKGEDYPGTINTFTEAVKDFNAMIALIDKKVPAAFKEIIPKAAPTPAPAPAPKPEPAYVAESVVPAPAAKKECKSRFNINELAFKIQSGFPAQLKDCSAALAKSIALSKSPFGKKPPAPEPKTFMTECAIEGIKQNLPPGAGDYAKPVEGFVRNILNAASAANGELDVKKLSGAIGGMDVMDLISELKAKAAYDDCAADEPYSPPAAPEGDYESDSDEEEGEDGERKVFSLGIRTGFNFSHVYVDQVGSYKSIPGFQLGLVFDWALNDWFHIQPGFMYIQKGTADRYNDMTLHYIDVPALLSLKLSAFRLNAGPYFGLCLSADYQSSSLSSNDIGISSGLGLDIGWFYVGMFYEHGLWTSGNEYHNRTLGLNLGVNL